jgi:hypothetical protein
MKKILLITHSNLSQQIILDLIKVLDNNTHGHLSSDGNDIHIHTSTEAMPILRRQMELRGYRWQCQPEGYLELIKK